MTSNVDIVRFAASVPSRWKPLASTPCCDMQIGNCSTKDQCLDSHDGEGDGEGDISQTLSRTMNIV